MTMACACTPPAYGRSSSSLPVACHRSAAMMPDPIHLRGQYGKRCPHSAAAMIHTCGSTDAPRRSRLLTSRLRLSDVGGGYSGGSAAAEPAAGQSRMLRAQRRCAKLASPLVSEALDTLIALLDGALIEGSGMPEYRRPE
jgi:hypothetical protein